MAQRADDLPEFTNPPVVEVILGIQFGQVPGFGVIHYGLLWERFAAEFPNFREMPPIEPTFELFGARPQTSPSMQFEIIERILPRLWLTNDDETRLIQVQPDSFVHNWRKVGDGDEYPRYETIQGGFFEAAKKFSEFLEEQSLPTVQINQCEITYINQILVPEDAIGRPQDVFSTLSDGSGEAWPEEIEDVKFLTRHILRDIDGKPIGRLHVQVDPGIRNDGKPVYMLNITARGRPQTLDFAGAARFFDFGRDKIVRRFADITTHGMHQLWGRTK